MAVSITFMQGSGPGTLEYEDGDGSVYRYEVRESGALAVYETSQGEFSLSDSTTVAVYGPAAWFSVTGAAWGSQTS